jgi:centromere protein I
LAKYKRAFEPLVAPNVVDQQAYPKDYVNHFNGFLMDLCNCLWRSRAFNTSDVNSLGCLIPEPVTAALTKYVTSLGMGLDMAALFSLSYSPAISMQAISYLRELEDAAEGEISIRQAGPVTQASLRSLQRDGGINMSWRDYRLGVLQYLEGNGAPGVGQLMYNTIKNLMT